MRRKKFGKFARIITLMLFLIVLIPSALSQAERNADRGTDASAAVGAAGSGVGTIAMGRAIAEAAVIAVAELR